MNDYIRRIREVVSNAEDVSPAMLAEIDGALQRQRSADLLILRGDALQLTDGGEGNLEEAEKSYREALAIDPHSAAAHEALGYFIFAVKGDSRGSLGFFRRAIELGAGASAHEGLFAAGEDLAESEEIDEEFGDHTT